MTYYPGIPDGQFIRGDIPMTKQEVRILTLAKAKIDPHSTVIDIGAGTGSLSIEAAFQAYDGRVFAIERESEGIELIKANATQFGLNNITVIAGTAPEAMAGLPQADVIFIGGSGGQLKEILQGAFQLLSNHGRLIINAITVETVYSALKILREEGYQYDACCVQVNRINPIGQSNMLYALNPVYIITGNKGGTNER